MGKRVRILRETMKAAEDGCYFVRNENGKDEEGALHAVCDAFKDP